MKFLYILLTLIILQGCQNTKTRDVDIRNNTPKQTNRHCFSIKDCAAEIRNKIAMHWLMPIPEKKYKVKVLLMLNESAEVENVKILESSGSKLFDKSALEAIQASSPFTMIDGLSKEDREKFKEIIFEFYPYL